MKSVWIFLSSLLKESSSIEDSELEIVKSMKPRITLISPDRSDKEKFFIYAVVDGGMKMIKTNRGGYKSIVIVGGNQIEVPKWMAVYSPDEHKESIEDGSFRLHYILNGWKPIDSVSFDKKMISDLPAVAAKQNDLINKNLDPKAAPGKILTNDNTEKKILQAILSVCRPIEVFVFGSRGRGTNKPDSDYDIAVIVQDNFDKKSRRLISDLILEIIKENIGTDIVDIFVSTKNAMKKDKLLQYALNDFRGEKNSTRAIYSL